MLQLKRYLIIFIFSLLFCSPIFYLVVTNSPNEFKSKVINFDEESFTPRINAINSSSPTIKLSYDARSYIGLNPSIQSDNYTGKGVTVAIMDSGIQANHSVFTFNGMFNWSHRIVAFYDASIENITNNPHDIQWHGTWTASILGGNSSTYKGVAPNVKFLIMKIFYIRNSEVVTDLQTYEKAVDWLLKNGYKYNVKIVSMSFGVKPDSANIDEIIEMNAITKKLIDNGMLVVAAAGNDGDDPERNGYGTINAPASERSVLGVGGVDYDGKMYEKSSKGPTYENIIKPDVCAPAVYVYGAYPSPLLNSYAYASGTSASTPFVAGLAALMLEKNPSLSPEQLKSIICLTSVRTINPIYIMDNVQGWGVVQGHAALQALNSPVKLLQNSIIHGTLNNTNRACCLPIELNPGQYYFELTGNNSLTSVNMFLFSSTPDKYGTPFLKAHSINDFAIWEPSKKMGIQVYETSYFYLVIKSSTSSNIQFIIKLGSIFINNVFVLILITNLACLTFVIYLLKKLKRIDVNRLNKYR